MKIRYAEDYQAGDIFELGSYEVNQEEIIEFSKKYDPFPFHIDEKAAQETVFKGIILKRWRETLESILQDMYLTTHQAKMYLHTWKLFIQFSFLLRRVRTDALCIGFRLLLPRIGAKRSQQSQSRLCHEAFSDP